VYNNIFSLYSQTTKANNIQTDVEEMFWLPNYYLITF